MTKKTKDLDVTESSGNVFADLRFPNPEREQLKAEAETGDLPRHQGPGPQASSSRRDSGHCPAARLGTDERSLRQLFCRPPIRVPERLGPRRRNCRSPQSAESCRRAYERCGASMKKDEEPCVQFLLLGR